MASDLPPWVDGWCRTILGAEPVEALFRSSYLSEVVGVRLTDGREVVVKRRVDESGRAARCVTAQRLLAEQGFPCPMPLTDVIVSEGVAVHAERFIPGGELETRDTPEVAARSGRLLADLARRLATLDLDPPLPNPEWVRWDAMPEREEAAPVPAWIEDATRRVQAKLAGCDLPPVLGHADWEAQNIRWRNEEAHAVHDWDSLAWLPKRRSPEAPLGSSRATARQARAACELRSLPPRLRKRTRRPLLALRNGDRLGGEHLGSSPQRPRRTQLRPAEAQLRTTESRASRTPNPSPRRLRDFRRPKRVLYWRAGVSLLLWDAN